MNKEDIKKETIKNISNTMDDIKSAMLARAEQAEVDELIAMHTDCLTMLEIAHDTEAGRELMDLYCEKVEE